MPSPSPIIVWFRNDLRLAGNPALAEAAGAGRPVIPLYILDETPGVRPMGGASRWWLDKSLASLAADLKALGNALTLRRGVAADVLAELVTETGATAIFWNRRYDSASMTRDAAIKTSFHAEGVSCRSFNGALLNEPWEVASGSGEPYRVFTPYWRAARERLGETLPTPDPAPARLQAPAAPPRSDALPDWGLHPTAPDWSGGFSAWRPGERGAHSRLEEFLKRAVGDYAQARDRPDVDGTSALSPHLAFGEIGPRQIWWAAQALAPRGAGLDTFLKELGWREFGYHILFHNPEIATKNFKREFDAMTWRQDPEGLEAWRRGATGYPIVDAGMRQLWATGWMHNRVRMVVASFLIKDLLIDWRVGEAWFWDTLVDADPASNAANWQWVAGSGADAAPYFRIFNPATQARTHDPDGVYTRRWAPDADSPSYPAPIVDHAVARDRALDAFQGLRQ